MIILTIRTDNPEAEIGIYDGETQLRYEAWHAHRELAETLHQKLTKNMQSIRKDWSDIDGIAVYEGPGSFTGLRIGMSVANALAYSLQVPIIATTGVDWIEAGINQLQSGKGQKTVMPNYGSDAHVTAPKK